jgi:hypothetical protein
MIKRCLPCAVTVLSVACNPHAADSVALTRSNELVRESAALAAPAPPPDLAAPFAERAAESNYFACAVEPSINVYTPGSASELVTGTDPYCQRGIRGSGSNFDICCMASCGRCAPTVGCKNLPGGAAGCCPSTIRKAGKWCHQYPASCVIHP